MPFRSLVLAVLCCCLFPVSAAANQIDPAFAPLVQRLVADGFAEKDVRALLASPGLNFSQEYMGKKIRALYVERMGVPKAEPMVVDTKKRRKRSIYDAHIPPQRLAMVRYFYWENQDVLRRVEREFGVPREVVLAFMVIETRVGEYMGEQKAFRSLASMAVTRKYTDINSYFTNYQVTGEQIQWMEERMRQKADWAYTQLKALIKYAKSNNMDPVRIPGSIYGAFGLCQFIPTSALERGKDGDGDGYCNLFVPADAIMSIGNFLRVAGWKPGLSRSAKHAIIKRYNQDNDYADMVLEIASRI